MKQFRAASCGSPCTTSILPTLELFRCISTNRRTDRLCVEIWKMIQSGRNMRVRRPCSVFPISDAIRTWNLGVMDFSIIALAIFVPRTTWMLAMGPGVRQNVLVDRPIDSMDLVPTLGSYLGFSPAMRRASLLRVCDFYVAFSTQARALCQLPRHLVVR